ncbi:hypothetical protein GOP47_0001536 [Adiantum capillus-veneris]|uniref:WRKY domain-containing protein n=1 Tax=Adiantum capillus-veneris TaxID=13818 RepID=A0A9D4V8W1_ADICA|nr:hypothetical protein GOP47_0001536 [Adiantum capillus-veneris]
MHQLSHCEYLNIFPNPNVLEFNPNSSRPYLELISLNTNPNSNPSYDPASTYDLCPHFNSILICHLCAISDNESSYDLELRSELADRHDESSRGLNASSSSSQYGDAFGENFFGSDQEFVSTDAVFARHSELDSHLIHHSHVYSTHAAAASASSPSLLGHTATASTSGIEGSTRPSQETHQTIAIRVKGADPRTLFDGYFWRKYGEKSIKNKKHKRSYFKCAESGCDVTKHLELCSEDSNFVIVTYNGKHYHAPQHV